MQCTGWFQSSCFCCLWLTRRPTKMSGRKKLKPRLSEFDFQSFLVLCRSYCPLIKITFNTIDNLIWKPQQTNTKGERRGGWWKRIIEPSSGLQLVFLLLSLFDLWKFLLFVIISRTLFSKILYLYCIIFASFRYFLFRFAREEKCFPIIPPVRLWSVKGRSNKRLLGLAVKLYSLLFYQTNT